MNGELSDEVKAAILWPFKFPAKTKPALRDWRMAFGDGRELETRINFKLTKAIQSAFDGSSQYL